MKKMSGMWAKLALMALLSFVAMFGLMYMMVDSIGNVYPNFNQLYMAGAMTAAMVAIEVLVMGSMYGRRRARIIAVLSSAALLAIFFMFTRRQTAVTDRDFLRAMIPHHGGAILMCKNPNLQDPEILNLCRSITSGQQSEIDFMKMKLQR
jgi:uncharacterized protein (DUF305 family)